MTKDITTTTANALQNNDSEYVRLVSLISGIWESAKGKAALAVNTELLDANWQTGRYIVEFEQHGNIKAEYGKQLLTNLSRDLTRLRGKGYSRSNLFNMRLFYLRFPKIQTVSGQLTMEPLSGVAQVRRHYGNAILLQNRNKRRVEGSRIKTADKKFTVPTSCSKYRQRRCAGSCQRRTPDSNLHGHHTRPIRIGICWTTQTETLQGKGLGRCAEGSHGAILDGTRPRLRFCWPTVHYPNRKSTFQGGSGFLPLHTEMLRIDRPETSRDKTQRHRADESLSELFQNRDMPTRRQPSHWNRAWCKKGRTLDGIRLARHHKSTVCRTLPTLSA